MHIPSPQVGNVTGLSNEGLLQEYEPVNVFTFVQFVQRVYQVSDLSIVSEASYVVGGDHQRCFIRSWVLLNIIAQSDLHESQEVPQ